MSSVLEGAVQLDRTGPPPRVMLDTAPATLLDVPWRDIVGCWRMRVGADWRGTPASMVFDVLVVVHRGLFVRLPEEDAFWPAGERYGLKCESLSAVAQRDQRQRPVQMQIALPSSTDLGNVGIKPRRRKKGRR